MDILKSGPIFFSKQSIIVCEESWALHLGQVGVMNRRCMMGPLVQDEDLLWE